MGVSDGSCVCALDLGFSREDFQLLQKVEFHHREQWIVAAAAHGVLDLLQTKALHTSDLREAG